MVMDYDEILLTQRYDVAWWSDSLTEVSDAGRISWVPPFMYAWIESSLAAVITSPGSRNVSGHAVFLKYCFWCRCKSRLESNSEPEFVMGRVIRQCNQCIHLGIVSVSPTEVSH